MGTKQGAAKEHSKQALSIERFCRNIVHLDVQGAHFCAAWHALREDPRCTPRWCPAGIDTAYDKARLRCVYKAMCTSIGIDSPS